MRSPRVTRLVLCSLIPAALGMAACSPPPGAVVGPTWQLTGLYLDPQESGDLPESAAGLAMLSFGESTLTGDTGCSRLQGIVRFSREGKGVAAQKADAVRFERIDLEDQGKDCQGGAAYVDSTLRELLTGEYDIARPSEAELVLTQRSDEVDPPAMRLTVSTT